VKKVLERANPMRLATLKSFGRVATEPSIRGLFGLTDMNAREIRAIAALLAAALPAMDGA
jgi:hypothetical protein